MVDVEVGSLDLGKSVDEIEAPVLLPEEWYLVEVGVKPEVKKNAAMERDANDPKAGYNWVMNLVTISEDEDYHGRWLTCWLGIPKEDDEKVRDRRGQKVFDAKMQRIVDFVTAFGGTIDGGNASLQKGATGMVYVLQRLNSETGELENSVNIFGRGGESPFKPNPEREVPS